MRRTLARGILAAAISGVGLTAVPIYAQPAPAPASGEAAKAANSAVPVKVVVLFSSGVGYFEHGGAVDGDATTELRFKTQQVNDILKSLLLQDLGGGTVGSVVYPSQDPVEKTLKSFQVDITGDPSLAELLGQLRGARVQVVTAAGETLGGTVLGVEKRPRAVAPAGGDRPVVVDGWVLNLIAGGTIRAVDLGEAKKIDLEDRQLQDELARALSALAQARDQDKKPVTIHFAGTGRRQVRIGYVVETPVWKTSYRLVLPGPGAPGADKGQDKDKADGAKGDGAKDGAGGDKADKDKADKDKADKPRLLGWAIVENQTDNDWAGVQLSLVSGRPISFIQDLYRPLYVPRPVVQPELFASLRPQTYDAGMETAEKLAKADEAGLENKPGAAGFGGGGGGGGFGRRAERQQQEQMKALSFDRDSNGTEMRQAGGTLRMTNAAASVQSVASASKVGELFQYTVGNVSLPRQQSAMIPIITDDIEIERLSIYNPNVLARNPLYGARVKNTTGKHLLQGPVTVIEGNSYAGDATIDNVPPGQERLISFGVDLEVLVDGTKNKQDDTIQTGKVTKGVLEITRKLVYSHAYTAQNKGDRDKTLVVEHPFRSGWKLASPEKYTEKTDSVYRFRVPLPAGKSATLNVVEEFVQSQSLGVLGSDVGTLEFYSKSDRIPKAVRDSLAKAVSLHGLVTDTQRKIDQRRQQINDITQEQARIRDNLRTVDRTSDYGTRLLKKLNDQETQIESLQNEIQGLQKTLDQQKKDFETYVQTLNVE